MSKNTKPPAEPLVSIVMPNYNGAHFLEGSIQSVLDQTYKNWELLIIDDGSTDDSISIIKKYSARDPRIKLLKTSFEKNVPGPAAARNTGIKAAQGDYIAFLDSDDIWLPHKLSVQIPFMQNHGAAISHGCYDIIDEKGKHIRTYKPQSEKCDYKTLLKGNQIGCLTAIYDVRKLGKHYIEMSPGVDDFILWLKILKHTDYSWCVQEILGRYRIASNSVSSDKINAAKRYWITLLKIEKLPLPKSIYYFLNYVFYACKKRVIAN